ncbi:MAG TPA: formate/nitrite transporter family protein [Hyphomicrobiales bacterium]|nr:formate/nitrite transporter family protein [Rhodobiaceae bacterium]HXK54636.1 formate/nitrite transporter family protein [Hyphomicrobiales bacterium]
MAGEDRLKNAAAPDPTGTDNYSPAQMAQRVEAAGVTKAGLALHKLVMLALLAGVFIAFGAALYTAVIAGADPLTGPLRLLGGLAFSLGLILVVVGGAELFTGNALIVMAWADGKVSSSALLRNWAIAYLGNAAGGIALALLVLASGILDAGPARGTAIAIAEAKMHLAFVPAFFRGVLCNMLVCLAVWLCFAARGVTGKILAILFPISAFVALGFEHSIANFYFVPLGLMLGAEGGLAGMAANLVPVTLGNIAGGAGGVAAVYWVIYRR